MGGKGEPREERGEVLQWSEAVELEGGWGEVVVENVGVGERERECEMVSVVG